MVYINLCDSLTFGSFVKFYSCTFVSYSTTVGFDFAIMTVHNARNVTPMSLQDLFDFYATMLRKDVSICMRLSFRFVWL